MILLQDAAHPDGRRHLVLGHADGAAGQFLRGASPAVPAEVNAVVAECARQEHRQGDERAVRLLVQREEVAREGHFGGIELREPEHPEEDLLNLQPQAGEIDALRPDRSLMQGPRPVIVPARERQGKVT